MAAGWIREHAAEMPLTKGWRLAEAQAKEDGLELVVVVVDDRQVDAIRTRSRMEQMAVARSACPPAEMEVWDMLGERPVVIDLRGPNGSISRATCRR